MLASAPSPKKTPTRAQVLRAKSQAVGGKRKRCQRGKNCSAACIAGNETCLVEFPLPVSQAISKTRNALLEYITSKNKVQPGSVQEKRLSAAVESLGKVLEVQDTPGDRKPEAEWKRDQKRAERRALTWKEIQGIQERAKTLENIESDPEILKAFRKEVMGRGLTLPRAEVEMIYDALPANLQKGLNSAGRSQNKWWAGKDENGNDIFKGGSTGNRERGIAMLDIWLRQGGTDAYQGRGGKVWALQDLNAEHVVPKSKGGTDSPTNIVLVRAGTNQARGAKDLDKWVRSLPKTEEEYRGYLSQYRGKRTKKNVKNAILKSLDPKQYTDQEVFSWGAAKTGKAFGERTLFTGMFQPIKNITGNATAASSGPPLPFAKAAALIAKTQGIDQARKVVYDLRNIWNKQLVTEKSISPQEAFKQMKALVEKNLTPEQNGMFQSAAQSWASSRDVKQYGFL